MMMYRQATAGTFEHRGSTRAFIENRHLRAVVEPERGADLIELWAQATDVQPLLTIAQRPLQVGRAAATDRGEGSDFFDDYPGGMQQIFPNGGPSVEYDGVQLGFHGEACKVSWDVATASTKEAARIACTTLLARSPVEMRLEYILGMDDRSLKIRSTITNLSTRALDAMWGFHPAFGGKFLEGGVVLHADASTAVVHPEPFGSSQELPVGRTIRWPGDVACRLDRMNCNSAPSADLFYLRMQAGWYVLVGNQGTAAVTMRWELSKFPFLWVWQERHDDRGYPWFGRYHIIGIEPWSSYPGLGLNRARETGTLVTIPGSASMNTTLRIGVVPWGEDEGVPIGVGADGNVLISESREQ